MKKRTFTALAAALGIIFCLSITASAEMLDKDTNPPVVASSGSFESTYKTRMDFSFSGGTMTSAEWTRIKGHVGYILIGTCKEGETVSLSLTGTQSPVPDENANANIVFNSLYMTLTFRDGNQKVIGEEKRYNSGNVKDSSLSHQLGGSVPDGTKTVVIVGGFKCRWMTSVVAEESVGITVELKVEEASSSVLPIEPESTSKPEPEPIPKSEVESNHLSSPLVPGQEPPSEPWDEEPWDGKSPWVHAGPLATIFIAAVSALATIFGGVAGGAVGSVAGAVGESAGAANGMVGVPDPAYERAKVPDYPDFVTGQDGERISKKPDGTIEVSYPNGAVAVHFPNGTVQERSPDGATREEWPDGTISGSDGHGTFVTQTPDGTMTVVEPNGEETVFNPDGTSVETKSSGLKITRNAQGETVSAERNGYVTRRHPENPDALVMNSPYGGSVLIRTEQEWETYENENGRLAQRQVDKQVVEGEIRSENATHIYRRDGSRESRGDDGSVYTEDKDGNINLRGSDGMTYEQRSDGSVWLKDPDGTDMKYNGETGEFDFKNSDGSCAKGNLQTGEIDVKMEDGSYWKRDARGNGSFDNKEGGARGVCRKDGSFKIELEDGSSLTQQADGTMILKANDGTALIKRSDGTEYLRLPDGTELPANQP